MTPQEPPVPTAELRELCAAALEERLTPEAARRLETLVLTDAAARRFYVEFLHQHAALAWSATDPENLREPQTIPAATGRRSRAVVKWAGWAVAAGLLVAIGWLAFPRGPAHGFAAILEVKSGKWDGGSLPTEEGARLAAGRLRLSEGLVHIVFDNGADVRLEGPAELELLRGDLCVLHAGRLVAKVPETAHGFRVLTPTADLTDLGTEFGVSVRDGQTSDVQVFEGRVDVTHRGTGRVEKMLTGRGLRFGPNTVTEFDQTAENPPAASPAAPVEGEHVLTLSTASGKGKDGYIEAVPSRNPKHRSDVLLLVKSSVVTKNTPFTRKSYIGLDVSSLARADIRDAQITFTTAPTNMGFASEVPDATFSLYGLTDESLDGWDEKSLRWADAPANDPQGPGLDASKVVKLGEFKIAQGVHSGARTIAGPALVEFLKRDTNGTATFILVRDTLGSGRNDLVHGFANKRHPTLPPPTLKVILK